MATTLYPGIPFSPQATLTDNIGAADTIIKVSDVSAFPDPPNLATIGTDEEGETILYTAKTPDALSGCQRGVEGTARAWTAGELIGRNFTAKDHADLIAAVSETREAAATAATDAARAKEDAQTAADAAATAQGAAETAQTAATSASSAASSAQKEAGEAKKAAGEAVETATAAADIATAAAEAATTAATDAAQAKEDAQTAAEKSLEDALAADVGCSMAGKTVEPTQGTTVTAADGAEIFNDYRERTWGTDEGYEIVVPTRGNIASGFQSHSEGSYTTATGAGAHAEGNATLASGQNAHAEGGRFTGDVGCIASGYGSHAEGVSTKASASGAHSEGRGTIASEESSHSEGYRTTASGPSAHAEGYMGIAEGSASHVEGGMVAGKSPNKASGYAAHAEGVSTLASGGHSHAEGEETTASNTDSHAEGFKTTASAIASHSEGVETIASGEWGTHAEGYKTQASANYSHAEGENTRATGPVSHAEGGATTASGYRAHAEGYMTVASGHNSHSAGLCTIAAGLNQTAIGGANIESTNESDKFIIGSGAVTAGVVQTRSNCFRVTYNGVFSKGSYNSSGADYAELFEWSDGNPGNIDRAGRFVTLEGEHIRLAGPGDGYILGIVSGAPSVVGDVYDDQWQGMYLTDVFGRPIFEDVEVPDVTETFPDPENPESTISRIIIPAHTERRQKLNPDYDPAQTYVPRSDRPEWDAVGLLGKLVAVDDGTCVPNGWATVGEGGAATNSEEQTRYRVMARLDERHVRILIL